MHSDSTSSPSLPHKHKTIKKYSKTITSISHHRHKQHRNFKKILHKLLCNQQENTRRLTSLLNLPEDQSIMSINGIPSIENMISKPLIEEVDESSSISLSQILSSHITNHQNTDITVPYLCLL